MKKRRLVLEMTFLAVLLLIALFLNDLDACAWEFECYYGICFDYDQAFGVCENFCVSNGHIGCAEPWWIRSSCGSDCNELCLESFGIVCQDGYTARKYQYDFCAGCRL